MADRRRAPASGDQVVMTVQQVAEYLQLNRLTVYRYVREGKIPASKIGKLYRIAKDDVDRFLQTQKVGAQTQNAGKVDAQARTVGAPPSVQSRRGPPADRRQEPAGDREPAGSGRPVPGAPRDPVRPQPAPDVYVGPGWRQRLRERQEREEALLKEFPLEWVMRGFH